MNKNNKELAVELAIAVINSIPQTQSLRTGVVQPVSGKDVTEILNDCYNAVCTLDESGK